MEWLDTFRSHAVALPNLAKFAIVMAIIAGGSIPVGGRNVSLRCITIIARPFKLLEFRNWTVTLTLS